MVELPTLTKKKKKIAVCFKTQYCPLFFTRLCYCLCLHGSEACIVFQGFAFLAASIQKKEIITSRASGLFKLAILKYVLSIA